MRLPLNFLTSITKLQCLATSSFSAYAGDFLPIPTLLDTLSSGSLNPRFFPSVERLSLQKFGFH